VSKEFCGALVVIGSGGIGVSKVCSAPVEIGSGDVLLQRRCAPSAGRCASEDGENV